MSRGATGGLQAWGGTPCELTALPYLSWPPPQPSRVPSGPEKIIVKFRRVWTSFGADFMKS